MNKSVYLSGIVTVNIFVLGALFKVSHFPGANILISTGLISFCTLFLPAAFINNYTGTTVEKSPWTYVVGFVCLFVVLISAMFKVMHWPGAGLLLLISVPLPFLVFLPVYVYHDVRDKSASVLNFLGVMFLLLYIVVFTALLAVSPLRTDLVSIPNIN